MFDGFVSWPVRLQEEYVRRGYWHELTIGEMLDRSAEHFAHREVLVYGDLRITYAEFKDKVDRLSVHILNTGLRAGDIVVVQLPNVPEFIYVYFALIRIGVIPVLCLAQHREREIKYISEHVGARGYVFSGDSEKFDYASLGLRIKSDISSMQHLFATGDSRAEDIISISDLLEAPVEYEDNAVDLDMFPRAPAEIAVFLLSGGTTGMPKVIPRTHNDYLYNSEISGVIAGLNMYSVFLASTPLPHNFALASPGIQAVIQRGGKIIIPKSHRPEDVFTAVEDEGVTYVPAVPPMIINWVNYPGLDNYDLSSWEVLINGGAKLAPEVAARVEPTLGCRLQQIFGMAEGLLVMTELDDSEEVVRETVGTPISPADEVRIVDEDGSALPVGEVGEMVCRGPYTIRGYFRAPEHNSKAFTEDGFFKSGDVMRIREDGRMIVEGRKKDLINRGGEKINAEEVEDLILSHPDVENAAVVAMPDPLMGEKTCAYVIMKRGKRLTLDVLCEFMKTKNIAKFKLPERLEIVDEFPLTNVGKVSKKELREDIESRLEMD